MRAAGGPISSFAEKRGSFFSGPDGGGKWLKDAREWCDRWQSVGWAIGSLCAGAGVVGGIAARYIRHDVEAYVDGKIAQVVSKNDEFRVAATKTHYDFQQKISDLFLEYQRELNMLAKSHLQFQRDMMKLEHSIFLLPNFAPEEKGPVGAVGGDRGPVDAVGGDREPVGAVGGDKGSEGQLNL